MNILEQILDTKRREVRELESRRPFADLEREARACTRLPLSLSRALRQSPSGIIAEFKRRSPSKGAIRANAEPATVTAGYERAGAAAVSVLTDRDYFGGSLADLTAARAAISIPILRKDFVISRSQIAEARIVGADAVLLIASALTPGEVSELARYARSLGLESLLEIHTEEELEHICDDVDVVGINNRNLSTFVTDIRTSSTLGALIPARFPKISESGLSAPGDVSKLRAEGFRGFLIGENLMRQPDPAAVLEQFIGQI